MKAKRQEKASCRRSSLPGGARNPLLSAASRDATPTPNRSRRTRLKFRSRNHSALRMGSWTNTVGLREKGLITFIEHRYSAATDLFEKLRSSGLGKLGISRFDNDKNRVVRLRAQKAHDQIAGDAAVGADSSR